MLLVNGGGSKFFYDYVPLDAPTRSWEDPYSYEFTTRNLGIPDGTTIEFILDNDEKDIHTYVSPLTFRYAIEDIQFSSNLYYVASLVVWAENESHADSLLVYYHEEWSQGAGDFHAKMRYSY